MAKQDDDTPLEERKRDLLKDDKIGQTCADLYDDVRHGFEDQNERANELSEYWDIYNCLIGNYQFYTGNSKIFVPIVHDAIQARKTRFCNQIFPRNGRYIDCISDDGSIPHGPLALAEHYVRLSQLRQLMPALVKNGDLEGHYHIYCSWNESSRWVIQRKNSPVQVDLGEGATAEDPEETFDDVHEIEVKADHPRVEILGDSDVLVLPQTATNLDQALEQGGSVTILRRWSKTTLKKMIASGEIDKDAGEQVLVEMSKDVKNPQKDKDKKMIEAAGIKKDGRGKYCLVYETWTKLPVDDEKKICRVFFAGPDTTLSARRNPLWCDRLPIISCAVDKVQGAFKGRSLLKFGVKDIQYFANDAINEAADSSAFAMMPIIMTDPEKNPRIGSMVLDLAAIWMTSPKDTSFAQFPPLWKDGMEIVAQARQQIFQTLSVNPSNITQQLSPKGGKGRNQAEVANEQQVDILTTADAVSVLEDGILSPLVTLFMEMDYQYRDKPMSVPRYGMLGRKPEIEEIPLLQMDRRYQFLWLGVESARNMGQMQQQIAFINVLKGIPPQAYQGYKLDIAPSIVSMAEAVFGPRLAPITFVDVKDQISVDPQKENVYMLQGVAAWVHPMDDHQKHLKAHGEALKADRSGIIQQHMAMHQSALQGQMQAQAEQMQPKGQPGSPGGAGKGAAGTPRPGAQPRPQRPAQAPPGAMHKDQIPFGMPRKM